jgi:hypothetical protein
VTRHHSPEAQFGDFIKRRDENRDVIHADSQSISELKTSIVKIRRPAAVSRRSESISAQRENRYTRGDSVNLPLSNVL